uniref:Ig-like domain-containing protein n=1 Tax=Calidris pygmaea TaxID=425635 RepID=A0A8C3J1E5_9CHAR
MAVLVGHWLTPVFSPLSSPSPGSLVQAAVTQPASVSANVGQTVRITCSGGSSYFGWYQQKVPGTGPVTVIYDNTNRPSGIPSRFSGSYSGSTATLTITGVQAEDEAVYFCGSYDGSSLVQAALTQQPSVSEDVGKTVRITCSGVSSSSGVGWFQQKVPGTAPVTVIYQNDKRPSGIPSRFSGSLSGSTGTLTITGVQAEDEAVYFCGGQDGSSADLVVTPSHNRDLECQRAWFHLLLLLDQAGPSHHLWGFMFPSWCPSACVPCLRVVTVTPVMWPWLSLSPLPSIMCGAQEPGTVSGA